ncbi:MAG: hypothetical protein PVI92_14985, partial [Chromatiales bacterium]
MHLLKSLPRTFTCLLFAGMGVTGLCQAGFPQGNVDAQAVYAQVANKTNRIIVKYRESAARGTAGYSNLAEDMSQTTGRAMNFMRTMGTGAQVFKLGETLPMGDVQDIIQQIEADPNVEYAEPDRRLFHMFTPNDSRYNEQWHLFDDTVGIGMPEAWDTTQGEGAIVAVIDTGYLEHADLVDNLILPGYDLMSDTSMSNDGD